MVIVRRNMMATWYAACYAWLRMTLFPYHKWVIRLGHLALALRLRLSCYAVGCGPLAQVVGSSSLFI